MEQNEKFDGRVGEPCACLRQLPLAALGVLANAEHAENIFKCVVELNKNGTLNPNLRIHLVYPWSKRQHDFSFGFDFIFFDQRYAVSVHPCGVP